MVYAPVLGTGSSRIKGSSPFLPTKYIDLSSSKARATPHQIDFLVLYLYLSKGSFDPLFEPMKKTILVVDDHEMMLDVIKRMLAEFGFDVVSASNGKEALDVLKHIRPDLILSDVQMPEIDGIELAKRAPADIPFVFMTGKLELNSRSIENRIPDKKYTILEKPFSKMALVMVLDDHLK